MSRSWEKTTGWRGHQWLGLPARVYLGLVFVIASWHKILDPGTFALDVATYQILPLWAVNGLALALPWVELLAGGMLILGFRARAAALLVTVMMLSFITALLWGLHLGLDMACGCFASQAATTDDPISWRTLARDGLWLALGLYVLILDRIPLGLDRILHGRAVNA